MENMALNDLLYKAEKITMTRYDVSTNADAIIEDLICSYHSLEEEFEDYKDYVKDNYRQIPVSEQIGISDRDFM